MADKPGNRSGSLKRRLPVAVAASCLLAILATGCQSWPENAIVCDSLAESACMNSAACTWARKSDRDFVCRADANHCEALFRQSKGTADHCEAKAGCEYVPAVCYCPPGVECICGGGDPPTCGLEPQAAVLTGGGAAQESSH
jgi:hypothetical protein